jgi:hypothetical protein
MILFGEIDCEYPRRVTLVWLSRSVAGFVISGYYYVTFTVVQCGSDILYAWFRAS